MKGGERIMEQDKVNQIIGALVIKEKYKFVQDGIVGEVCRDFVNEYEKDE